MRRVPVRKRNYVAGRHGAGRNINFAEIRSRCHQLTDIVSLLRDSEDYTDTLALMSQTPSDKFSRGRSSHEKRSGRPILTPVISGHTE